MVQKICLRYNVSHHKNRRQQYLKKKLQQTILIVQYLACRWKFSETCLNFYSSGYSASLSQALVKIFNIETDEIFITLQAALFSTNKEE